MVAIMHQSSDDPLQCASALLKLISIDQLPIRQEFAFSMLRSFACVRGLMPLDRIKELSTMNDLETAISTSMAAIPQAEYSLEVATAAANTSHEQVCTATYCSCHFEHVVIIA